VIAPSAKEDPMTTDRFEQEFYKSPWHRVLAVGPQGIQPYVRPVREPGARAGAVALRRLAALAGLMLRRTVAFGRWAATGTPKRAMLEDLSPRGRRPALRIASKTAGRVSPDPGTLRPLCKAA
jgi:hypothetical protein